MPETLHELAAHRELSPRRRLVVAIGGMLVLGVIAATIAQEQRGREEAEATSVSPFDLASVVKEIERPPSLPPAAARPDPQATATEALRVHVDRYIDARAAALRTLDAARQAGVDPAVISAMAAVLGMPADAPSPRPEGPSDPSSIEPPRPGKTEPRAL